MPKEKLLRICLNLDRQTLVELDRKRGLLSRSSFVRESVKHMFLSLKGLGMTELLELAKEAKLREEDAHV